MLSGSLFLFFFCGATAGSAGGQTKDGQASGRATVKSDLLAVYAGMSTTSKLVKSLKKGDVLKVDFEVVASSVAWCSVKEAEEVASLGYALCQYLEREQPPHPFGGIAKPATAGAIGRASQPSAQPPQGGDERIVESTYMRHAWNFASLLKFSEDQQAQLPQLAERTGVARCIQEMEAAYRRHGVPTTKSEVDKLTTEDLKRLQPKQDAMARELMPSMRPCFLSMLTLSELVLDLATTEQRTDYAFQIKAFRDILKKKRASILAGHYW